MKTYIICALTILPILISGCNTSSGVTQLEDTSCTLINFGNVEKVKNSQVISDLVFLPLESHPDAMLQTPFYIKLYNEKIYVQDGMNVFVFSKEGNFLRKMENRGDGPGEFLNIQSFWIDEEGHLFVLDTSLKRLLKYEADNFKFIEEIEIPYISPLTFGVVPNKELYAYYYGSGGAVHPNKQIVIADKHGNVKQEFLEMTPVSKVSYGNPQSYYQMDGNLNISPYFSTVVYALSDTTLSERYHLSFGKYKMPDIELFEKNGSREIMREIDQSDNNYLSILYVHESKNQLVVKYTLNRYPYMGVWNKKTNKVANFEAYQEVEDDLGIGTKFPYVIANHGEQFIGKLNAFDVLKDEIRHPELKKIKEDIDEEDNPILVFYTLKDIE